MKKQKMDDHKNALLRSLPKIDEIMLSLEKRDAFVKTPRNIVKSACRSVVEELRQEILKVNMDVTDIRLPEI